MSDLDDFEGQAGEPLIDPEFDDDGALSGVDSNDDGEDLMANQHLDYQSIEALDSYDAAELDNQDYEAMDMRARMRAEAEMDEAAGGRKGRSVFDDDDLQFQERLRRRQRRRMAGDVGTEEDDDVVLELEKLGGDIAEHLRQDNVQREVKRRWKEFLTSYATEEAERQAQAERARVQPLYLQRIMQMARQNEQTLLVSYTHLHEQKPTVAVWCADHPAQVLPLLDAATLELVVSQFPTFASMVGEVHVRFYDFLLDETLRALRQEHLNKLVQVTGVVTRRTGVFPALKQNKYLCLKCNALLGPFMQTGDNEVKPQICETCQSKGPFRLSIADTIFRNFQKLTIQEAPGDVPAGRVPRSKDVVVTDDLIDAARPGEKVELVGIYETNFDVRLNTRNGFPVFDTYLVANNVTKKGQGADAAELELTAEDISEIQRYAKKRDIVDVVVASIAPSIYGHVDSKTAIALSLFGGVPRETPDHRTRGDINVLLLGDPGMAKSQFLKYVEHTAPRAVYATGKGASAVGLTASVRRDQLTREWTLEGGALVLADRGVCLIDEFDKMNEQDRVSIHEAMEQQSISVSKAGIITTLQARCAVIAAANPLGGRYNASLNLIENVDLTDPILSRFDIIIVVRDLVKPKQDERLAFHVVSSHMQAHPDFIDEEQIELARAEGVPEDELPEPDVVEMDQAGLEHDYEFVLDAQQQEEEAKKRMPQSLLRKYLMYARRHCQPQWQNVKTDKILAFYEKLRQESHKHNGLLIAARHIESIIRIATAFAKMRLHSHVQEEDVSRAIKVVCRSFISTNKYAVQHQLRKVFGEFFTEDA